jgi:hypothetical protein
VATHNFGSSVDSSSVIEQVPSTGPSTPTATTAPKRPPRGTVGKVRNHATLADLPDFLTQDNGYWSYSTNDIPLIRISFDNWASYMVVRSAESMNAAATLSADLTAVDAKADTALTTANTALTTAQSIPGASWPIPGTPSTFPASAHTHTRSQISDASSVGLAVLGAVDPQAARAAIGAGTGNGTSNLQLGTTGTTAAPGNHSHTASVLAYTPQGPITATDVQNAIQQAATLGGSGSAAAELKIVRYVSGAYEALPATPDAAWKTVEYRGPTTPTPPTGVAWSAIQFDWLVRGA